VDTVLLFVMYVLMSVVIQPSWLPNPIKLIIISRLCEITAMSLTQNDLPTDKRRRALRAVYSCLLKYYNNDTVEFIEFSHVYA